MNNKNLMVIILCLIFLLPNLSVISETGSVQSFLRRSTNAYIRAHEKSTDIEVNHHDFADLSSTSGVTVITNNLGGYCFRSRESPSNSKSTTSHQHRMENSIQKIKEEDKSSQQNKQNQRKLNSAKDVGIQNQVYSEPLIVISQVPTSTLPSDYPPPPVAATEEATPILGDQETDSYPAPTPLEIESEPYIAPEIQLPSTMPAGTSPPFRSENESIDNIGSAPTRALVANGSDDQPVSSMIFLWLGFIVALLIFVAGVYGSIVLFTRQRSTGDR